MTIKNGRYLSLYTLPYSSNVSRLSILDCHFCHCTLYPTLVTSFDCSSFIASYQDRVECKMTEVAIKNGQSRDVTRVG
jgi:hypothetical protein